MHRRLFIFEALFPSGGEPRAREAPSRRRQLRSRRNFLGRRLRDVRELLRGRAAPPRDGAGLGDESGASRPANRRSRRSHHTARHHHAGHRRQRFRKSAQRVFSAATIAAGMVALFWILVSSCETVAHRAGPQFESKAMPRTITSRRA